MSDEGTIAALRSALTALFEDERTLSSVARGNARRVLLDTDSAATEEVARIEKPWRRALGLTRLRYLTGGTLEDGPCWCVDQPYHHEEPQCANARALLSESK